MSLRSKKVLSKQSNKQLKNDFKILWTAGSYETGTTWFEKRMVLNLQITCQKFGVQGLVIPGTAKSDEKY